MLCHFMRCRCRCSKQGSWLEPYRVGRFITEFFKNENTSAVWPGRRDYLYLKETRQNGITLAAHGGPVLPIAVYPPQ